MQARNRGIIPPDERPVKYNPNPEKFLVPEKDKPGENILVPGKSDVSPDNSVGQVGLTQALKVIGAKQVVNVLFFVIFTI